MALKFSIANPMGSILAWQLAQAGSSRCCSRRSRKVVPVIASWSSSNSGTSGGGGGGGEPSICSNTQRPLLTGDVRVGLEVTVKTLACVRMPPRAEFCNAMR